MSSREEQLTMRFLNIIIAPRSALFFGKDEVS